MEIRPRIGGAAIAIAGAFLAREFLIWLYTKVLDAASTWLGDVNMATFPWLDAIGVVALAGGLVLVFKPPRIPAAASPTNAVGGLLRWARKEQQRATPKREPVAERPSPGHRGTPRLEDENSSILITGEPTVRQVEQPVLTITEVSPNRRNLRNGARQIAVSVALLNRTGSDLRKCRVLLESLEGTDGRLALIGAPVNIGPEGEKFGMAAKQVKSFILLYRNYNVAPEEPVKFNISENFIARISKHSLKDNTTYKIGLRVDPGTGVITRATIEAVIGEYDSLKVRLVEQTYWRGI